MNKPKFHYNCIGCNKSFNTHKEYPYGWICLECRPTVKLILRCSVCGDKVPVFWDTYRLKDPNIPWRCRKCNDAYRNEVYNNRPQAEKDAFIESQRKRSQEYYRNRTQAEKDADSARRRGLWKIRKETGKDKPILDALKKGRQDWWDNLPEELQILQIASMNAGKEEWRKNAPPEEIERINRLAKEATQRRWDKMSPAERKEAMKPIHEGCMRFWKSMAQEGYTKWRVMLAKKRIESLEWQYCYYPDIKVKASTGIEIAFMNEMNRLQIEFIPEYPSTTFPPDFFQIFPSNPYTDFGLIDPTHSWDFLVHTLDTDMFVDIDGGMHVKESFEKEYLKGNVDEREYKQWKDSQRIFQTDGLPAYIIHCPDNIINDQTDVENITTGEHMVFATFKSLLSFMNTPEDERKKIASA